MTFQCDAIYADGVLRPAAPLALPNGASVRIAVEATGVTSVAREEATNDLLGRLRAFRGMLSGLSREQMLAERREGLVNGDRH
jgi:predicted DNA-binding antitoxin AbrB/MazE fold protein